MNVKTSRSVVSKDEIARRAYEIWQARGCPPGDGNEDWRAAETELRSGRFARNGSTQQRVQSWWSRVRQTISGRDA